MSKAAMATLASRCQPQFESIDRRFGEICRRDGQVCIEAVDSQGLRATVASFLGRSYQVRLGWVETLAEGILDSHCTCDRFAGGELCEHLWATILTMDAAAAGVLVPGQAELIVFAADLKFMRTIPRGWKGPVASQLIRHGYNPGTGWGPARGQQAGGKKPTRSPWQRTLAKMTPHPSRTDDSWQQAIRGKQREAWYVLCVGPSVALGEIIVELYQHETKKNGQFGKRKRLKLDAGEIDSFSQQADRELLAQLIKFPYETNYNSSYAYRSYGYSSRVSAVTIPESLQEACLPQLARTGRFLWLLDSMQPLQEARPLTWEGNLPWQASLRIQADDSRQCWLLDGQFTCGDQSRAFRTAVMANSAGLLLVDDTLTWAEGMEECYDWIQVLNQQGPIEIPYADREAFLKQFWSTRSQPAIQWPDNLGGQPVCISPQPKLKIYLPANGAQAAGKARASQPSLTADVSFLYGSREVGVDDPCRGLYGANQAQLADETLAPAGPPASGPPTQVVLRDRQLEAQRLAELGSHGVRPSGGFYQGPRRDVQFPRKNLTPLVDHLVAAGWRVEAEGKLFRAAGDFNIEVRSNIDWFELDASIDFDGVEAKLPQLLAAVRKGDRFVELGDGSRGMLPDQWLERYRSLIELGATEQGKIQFKPSQALLLDALLAEQDHLQLDRKFQQFRRRLASFSGVRPKNAPRTFQGTLRDYQRDGLGWFHFLRQLGLGGCLADDMGLGKTIQVLALLENRRTRRLKAGETRRPSLVVVPRSLIFNWQDEATRFTPKLRVANYTGVDRRERLGALTEYHLIVTTYGTLRRDITELKEQCFDYAILDESQAIKNSNSLAAKASRLLNADHRLTLTGTPIENHLGELWSMFEFLNPGMLGRSGAFATLCKSAVPGDAGALADLARAVGPFLLRRTKEQVLKELPAKTEQTIYCDLQPDERQAYDELRDYYRAMLTKKIKERGLKKAKIHLLEALLRLRQASCHPGLVNKKKTG